MGINTLDYYVEVVLTFNISQTERSARQVNPLAYKLTKTQQLPKTLTNKVINSPTHQLINLQTQKLTNLQTYQLINSKTHQPKNSSTYKLINSLTH